MLAGVPSGPKAAAAAGHIEAASRAQHAPLSAVDYVLIMEAMLPGQPERARRVGFEVRRRRVAGRINNFINFRRHLVVLVRTRRPIAP